MITETLERPVAASSVDLDLDARILTASPQLAALPSSTSNEYNTEYLHSSSPVLSGHSDMQT